MQATIPTAAPVEPTADPREDDQPMTWAADQHAQELRRQSDAGPRSKGDPPSWADLVAKAERIGLTVSGPISPPGGTRCAGLDSGGRRLFACQAMLVEGVNDNRDRLLRAALGATLWALGAK